MNTENTIQLIKELEKTTKSISIYKYRSAWVTFFISLFYLIYVFVRSFNQPNNSNVIWALALFYAFAFIFLFLSFYQILKYIFNKKFLLIIQAVLDLEKK
jgi:hypothetical protein